jgi:hypothetical protein
MASPPPTPPTLVFPNFPPEIRHDQTSEEGISLRDSAATRGSIEAAEVSGWRSSDRAPLVSFGCVWRRDLAVLLAGVVLLLRGGNLHHGMAIVVGFPASCESDLRLRLWCWRVCARLPARCEVSNPLSHLPALWPWRLRRFPCALLRWRILSRRVCLRMGLRIIFGNSGQNLPLLALGFLFPPLLLHLDPPPAPPFVGSATNCSS